MELSELPALPFPLRRYQEEGIKFLVEHRQGILGDKPGLGKTAQILLACRLLGFKRVFVFAPSNALWVWKRQISMWWPEMNDVVRIVSGTAHKRAKQIQELREMPSFVMLMTYGSMLRDYSKLPKAHALVCDEIHKRLRSRKTTTLEVLQSFHMYSIFLLSGTVIDKGAQDIWPSLSLLDGERFRSYWRFVNKFCYVDESAFGKQISGTKNVPEFKRMLQRYMIMRTKEQVADQLPKKIRIPVEVHPTSKQLKWQEDLITEMMTELENTLVVSSSVLGNMVKLRKLMVSPKLLDPTAEYGASIDTLLELIDELDEPHFVVYTPFREGVDIIAQALIEKGYAADKIYKFMGGLEIEEVGRQEKAFLINRGIAICTIAYAQSFELSSAEAGYFIGMEWNPSANEQAEDRQHRLSSKETVFIYYLFNKGTVDEQMIDVNNGKTKNIGELLGRNQVMIKTLQEICNEADAQRSST